ncbi:hypothetical protein PBY51_008288 [Eleginops maclovinus]|uniref:Uncharacterized protein n=1 Tax=Eleginops maclovinus TaxID=56733 RepID=A0AAN7X328_ELEMC|nr:hypothetical protein PBY51_008288 [Eleginops maclovinus]
MEETCYDSHGRDYQDSTGDEESNEEQEDHSTLIEGQEKWRENDEGEDGSPEDVTHLDEEEDDGISQDICGFAETESKLNTENTEDVETPKLSSLSDDYFESCRNKMDASMGDQLPDIQTEMFSDDEEEADNYTLRKHRGSGTSQLQGSRDSISEDSRKIATEIQQGEELLQRLQMLQLRQDECTPESPQTSKTVVHETGGETKGELRDELDNFKAEEDDLPGGDETEEERSYLGEDQEAKRMENEINESEEVEPKAGMSSHTTLAESEYQVIAGDSDDDPSESGALEDQSPLDPIASSTPRLSVDETLLETQIFEEPKGKQNMQRSGGLFNLTDNPDVLEFPFKTDILLEPFEPTKDEPDQRSDWQFSEQKMKKEISQDFQRELVMVNQGKIPGGYSKEETRQLKETKLLFEAFQQDNTVGPKRHRKPPTSLTKGYVYPSVMERTRSMRLFSMKSCPVSRSTSLKLFKDTEKSPEILRSLSSAGGTLDKSCLGFCKNQKQKASWNRSMDSINKDVCPSDVGARSKTPDVNTKQESPILKHNPFFKLRPALALQPEVEKEIREAKEREEELRRQRCTLYGENGHGNEDVEKSHIEPILATVVRKQSRGKLERVWPPLPSKKSEQEAKVQRPGGQKTLWQRWEAGTINGKPPKENN